MKTSLGHHQCSNFIIVYIFSLEEGEWSSYWLTVQLDKRLLPHTIQSWHPPTNSLLMIRTPRKAQTKRNRDCETQRGWIGMGLCFVQKYGLKYKKLACEFPNWLWVAKGVKSGRIFEGHLTTLHFQLICWLRNLTSTGRESPRPPGQPDLFIPVSMYIIHPFPAGEITFAEWMDESYLQCFKQVWNTLQDNLAHNHVQ